jgi:glutathione S-transferase
MKPMDLPLALVSHALCPYVQRAAIVLHEKGAVFERIDIDLANKPGWFLDLSPLGKTPLLRVDGHAIFESAVICEYLDDTLTPRLHPGDALQRARERSWVEFGSALLNAIAAFYNAPDDTALLARRDDLTARFAQIEAELGDGPFFAGERFGLVDAAFGPVFRYFDVFDTIEDFGVFDRLPRVQRWRAALRERESVRVAVSAEYAERLLAFLRVRGSALARRLSVVNRP